MPTISNHYDETFLILKEFNIPDDISYKIAHFASLYADNPNKIREFNIFGKKVNVVFQYLVVANNTFTNGSSLSYYCIRPSTLLCSEEEGKNINYWATRNSQNSEDPNETVRHSMLAKTELWNGIKDINTRYGFPHINNRYLNKDDFFKKYSIQPTNIYTVRNSLPFNSHINTAKINTEFNKYSNDIKIRIHLLEDIAKARGIRFGWEKIFKAADKARLGKFEKWQVDSNDSTGESGLALLGVGIHAIQDAYIHEGENMVHFEEHTTAHIKKDMFVGEKLRDITRKMIIVFLILSENFKYLPLNEANKINSSSIGVSDENQASLLNQKIIQYNAWYKNRKVNF